jgi:hypothetical protein
MLPGCEMNGWITTVRQLIWPPEWKAREKPVTLPCRQALSMTRQSLQYYNTTSRSNVTLKGFSNPVTIAQINLPPAHDENR